MQITLITMVYDTYITMVNADYKPTNITGRGPDSILGTICMICMICMICVICMICMNVCTYVRMYVLRYVRMYGWMDR